MEITAGNVTIIFARPRSIVALLSLKLAYHRYKEKWLFLMMLELYLHY